MTARELGAHCDETGASFAVFSSVADAVELCVFDPGGTETRHALELDEGFIWRGRVDGLQAGARYGYRVHGPYDPASGARCNPAKLLLDPYARAISGAVQWNDAVDGDNASDSAPYMPRSVVCRDAFDWSGERPAGHRASRLGDLRAARQGPHDAPSAGAPTSCAAPTAGWRSRR